MSGEEVGQDKLIFVNYSASGVDQVNLGGLILESIENSREWMYRVIDSTRIEASGDSRCHVSVDFCLPKEYRINESEHRIVIPITFLPKKPLQKLDTGQLLSGPSCVLTSSQNNVVAESFLFAAASKYLGNYLDPNDIVDDIVSIVNASPSDSESVVSHFQTRVHESIGYRKLSWAQREAVDVFMEYASSLGENFLFLVSVDAGVIGKRLVFKYSYDMPHFEFSRSKGMDAKLGWQVQDFGMASSYHLELRVPDSLSISRISLIEPYEAYVDSDGRIHDRPYDESDQHEVEATKLFAPIWLKKQEALGEIGSDANVGHCSLNPSGRLSFAFGDVRIQPARQGVRAFTWYAAILITFALLIASLIRWQDWPVVKWSEDTLPSPAASIVLVGPALLLSWLARTKEHAIVSAVLTPLRNALLAYTGVLLILAGLAAVPFSSGFWNGAWVVAVGISVVTLTFLLYAKFRKASGLS